jgi:hypothetical protein
VITIHFTRLWMANHHIRFTLGSHIQFGSLDFLCMGVDHDLVLLPLSVPVDPVSPSGFDERVGDLDPTGVEGERILPSPAESPNSPADINPIIESMVSLCLHANEAQASGGTQPMASTTQSWSVSLTPSWDHSHPRRISIASTSSSPKPCHSSQGDHRSPQR